jgi:hypothetical protein
MKKLFPIAVVVIVSVALPQQIHAAPQAKAGTKCSKANATQLVGSKKFTCIKSGSKLVWSAGKSVNGPAPKSSPTPTPIPTLSPTPTPIPTLSPTSPIEVKLNPFKLSPFPDDFTRAQMVEAVMQSFDDYTSRNSKNVDFILVLDAHFQQNNAKEIRKFVTDTLALLPFPVGYPTTLVVISTDKDLVRRSIKEYAPFYKDGMNSVDRIDCVNCAGLGWASSGSGVAAVTPHEIFHTWQVAAYKFVRDNSNPDPSNPLNPPVWLDEGGAEFFAQALYSKTTNIYLDPRGGAWFKLKPFRLKDYITRTINDGNEYTLGRLASEYIVASKGMEKFFQIYLNVGLGQDFPTAFESALGISLNSFYEKFDANLLKML